MRIPNRVLSVFRRVSKKGSIIRPEGMMIHLNLNISSDRAGWVRWEMLLLIQTMMPSRTVVNAKDGRLGLIT